MKKLKIFIATLLVGITTIFTPVFVSNVHATQLNDTASTYENVQLYSDSIVLMQPFTQYANQHTAKGNYLLIQIGAINTTSTNYTGDVEVWLEIATPIGNFWEAPNSKKIIKANNSTDNLVYYYYITPGNRYRVCARLKSNTPNAIVKVGAGIVESTTKP